MKGKDSLVLLRIMLLSAAFGWGISAFGIFLSWPVVVDQLTGLGAGQIPNEPMLNYWLRMTAGAFTAIGILFLLLAVNPRKYAVMLPFAGFFMIGEGLILLTYGLILGLDPLPFWVYSGFCLLLGIGITAAQKGLKWRR